MSDRLEVPGVDARFRVEARRRFGPFYAVRVFDEQNGVEVPVRGASLLSGMSSVRRAARFSTALYLRRGKADPSAGPWWLQLGWLVVPVVPMLGLAAFFYVEAAIALDHQHAYTATTAGFISESGSCARGGSQPTATYTVGGRTYTTQSPGCHPALGSVVTIHYQPSDPARADFNSNNDALVAALYGTGFTALGVFFIVSGRRAARRRAAGQPRQNASR